MKKKSGYVIHLFKEAFCFIQYFNREYLVLELLEHTLFNPSCQDQDVQQLMSHAGFMKLQSSTIDVL